MRLNNLIADIKLMEQKMTSFKTVLFILIYLVVRKVSITKTMVTIGY